MTYGDAINFLANSGNIYKAIAELSRLAEIAVCETVHEKANLRAEKRCVKRLLNSDMTDTEKVGAIEKMIEE